MSKSTLIEYYNRLDNAENTVKELSNDFCQTFHVSHFIYTHIHRDGKLGCLSSDVDYHRLTMETDYLDQQPYFDTVLKHGVYLWFRDDEPKFKGADKFYDARSKYFGIDSGLIVVKDCTTYLEACYFNLSDTKRSHNRLLNDIGLVKHFIKHFRNRITPAAKNLLTTGLNLSHFKKSSTKPTNLYNITTDERTKLIKTFGSSPLLKLSKRERETLAHLHKGYTYQQIGELLHLSERTIEQYINSIKTKLDLNTRAELITLAKALEDLKIGI